MSNFAHTMSVFLMAFLTMASRLLMSAAGTRPFFSSCSSLAMLTCSVTQGCSESPG